MAQHKVLLLGGHGKIAMFLTPLLLARSWSVTSVIRNPDHTSEILKLGEGQKGKIDVIINSLDEVKSDAAAKEVIDQVKPSIVIWSAGAGGKGGPSQTFAVDRDAAKHYIKTSLAEPSVKKFLMVSYIGSRRNRPSWWTDEDWNGAQEVNNGALKNYFAAKVEADEYLAVLAKKKTDAGDKGFQSINLRPGSLTEGEETGKITLGHTRARGAIRRADVAATAAALLERDDTRGWFDLLEGETPIEQAVDEVVTKRIDSFEGEDEERIYAKADL